MKKQKLTRKELVKHIKQTMPSDLNEIEKIAFIELEVAKNMSFDEKYLWGDRETKEKIYKLAKKEAQTRPRIIKRKLICVTMVELLGYVAKEFGFDVRYQKVARSNKTKAGDEEIFKNIFAHNLEHMCLLVGLSNKQFITIDVQQDLARLQTKSRPQGFGETRYGTSISNGVTTKILDKQVVNATFKKVYNLGEDEKFTDEYIMNITLELMNKGKTPVEILEIIMEDARIKEQVQNTRCVEANRLYKVILNACYNTRGKNEFSRGESQAIIEECILSDDEGGKRYSFCIYAEDNEQKVFYVYSKKTRRTIKLNKEEMQQLKKQSKNIELRGYPSSIKEKMKAFINNPEKYAEDFEKSENITLEDVFVDDDEQDVK